MVGRPPPQAVDSKELLEQDDTGQLVRQRHPGQGKTILGLALETGVKAFGPADQERHPQALIPQPGQAIGQCPRVPRGAALGQGNPVRAPRDATQGFRLTRQRIQNLPATGRDVGNLHHL